MSIFKLFKTKQPSLKPGLELNLFKEFENQDCRCVQQELNLSELVWMDTSSHQQAKQKLKEKSKDLMNKYLTADRQKDLFK
jgi:hypothetical protein